jgi:hypothetical protein
MAKVRGLFPETRLNVSSAAGAACAAAALELRLRGLEAELEPEPRPPRDRRLELAGPEGRCVGGRGKELWSRLGPAPRPAAPPPRPSFDEPPYIEIGEKVKHERWRKKVTNRVEPNRTRFEFF